VKWGFARIFKNTGNLRGVFAIILFHSTRSHGFSDAFDHNLGKNVLVELVGKTSCSDVSSRVWAPAGSYNFWYSR
jgi:hypothetical protein